MIAAPRLCARSRAFPRDEAGAVMVLWMMSLVAVLGVVALVIDLGRVQVAHGELQSFADSVALAAAGELDGSANAIARASAAAAEVADSVAYGGDTVLSGSGDYTLTFLTGLPSDDAASTSSYELSSPYDAADDAAAAFVRVQVTPATFSVNFLAATRALIGAANNDASVTAEAIAGFSLEACDVSPMMFCMPAGWNADSSKGKSIQLRAGGGNASGGAAWTPGEFGFLQQNLLNTGGPCAAYSGVKQDLCYLAAAGAVSKCYSQNGVDFKTGQSTGNFAAALNTRFDIFESTMGDGVTDALFAPAPNRISGIAVDRKVNGKSGNVSCSYDASTNTIALPPDTCFASSTCGTGALGRFGDGTWDRKLYFGVNYLHMSPTAPAADFAALDYTTIAAALPAEMASWLTSKSLTAETATRFEIYQAENAITGSILSGTGGDGNPIAETGRPACNLTSNPLADVYRRTIIAAGIACTDATGSPLYTGSASGVPVEEFVMLFLTKPAVKDASGDKFTIWAEVVGSVGKKGYGGAGTGGVFHDVVQLYR
ncbi:MAG: hypothetical protein KDK10_07470 [Maritimibacter sp.]|nr:hypothetical protein [Maritimibacter sp.]